MNIALIFRPLAFLSIFYTSVQGQVWPLLGAEVGNKVYDHTDQVSLERNDDGKTYVMHKDPVNFSSNVPEVVYGPFEMRGFGPYSMLITTLWLNTNGDNEYVSVTFPSVAAAREFYHVLNPYHSRTFPNDFVIERLALFTSDGHPMGTFEKDVPKALDLFLLETETGGDSRARIYIVHNTDGDQEPILMFHSPELEMTVDGDSVMLSIRPLNCRKKYVCSIKFEHPSAAEDLHHVYTALNALGFENNLRDLEALPANTYPSCPPHE